MKTYVESHFARGEYDAVRSIGNAYYNVQGWTDHAIGDHMIFSHRTTDYVAATFRDALHTHDFYEIVFWRGGDVRYILGDLRVEPFFEGAIVIPPNARHSTQLLNPSRYERYVFYIAKEAFLDFGCEISSLLKVSDAVSVRTLSEEQQIELWRLFKSLEDRLTLGGAGATLSAFSSLIEILLILGSACAVDVEGRGADDTRLLPEPVRVIRRYIEEHYDTILSVEEIAEHFYYSREYVSRLFRRYYNLSPAEYVERCRIREARMRIAAGERILDVCYGVGYRSMSAFSAAFRRVTGRAPSAFRRGKGDI